MDLALNNLQGLICHKTQQTQPSYLFHIYFFSCVQKLSSFHNNYDYNFSFLMLDIFLNIFLIWFFFSFFSSLLAMRRLFGRSKLKLTILLFLITISLLLGRLTISGLTSYQNYIGRQRHNGQLPNIKQFDIPYDTIREDQSRDYGAERLPTVKTNASNANVADSVSIDKQRNSDNADENIKTRSKKIVSNDEIGSDDTVTFVTKRAGLKTTSRSAINTTFQIQNDPKSFLGKVSASPVMPGNNSDVKHLYSNVVYNVSVTFGFRFNRNSSHGTLTEMDMPKIRQDVTETKKSPNLSDNNTTINIQEDEITSPVPSLLTTPGLLNPHSFQFIKDANNLCSRKEPPFLLVLVMSIHDHMDVRNAIRQTWGVVAKGGTWPGRTVEETVKLAFLLGLHQFPERESLLVAENEKYGDIIQENFVDSYYNLSIKMVMGLKWASQYCPGVRFILKADEDTFVNLPMLVDILRQPETPKDTIIGRIMPESKVYRVGKWSVDKKVYAGKVYPPYAAGRY